MNEENDPFFIEKLRQVAFIDYKLITKIASAYFIMNEFFLNHKNAGDAVDAINYYRNHQGFFSFVSLNKDSHNSSIFITFYFEKSKEEVASLLDNILFLKNFI